MLAIVTGDEAFRPARIPRQSASQPASPYIHIYPPVHALTGAIKDVGGYAIAQDSTFFASILPAAVIAYRH
jgi:hypothetical protein